MRARAPSHLWPQIAAFGSVAIAVAALIIVGLSAPAGGPAEGSAVTISAVPATQDVVRDDGGWPSSGEPVAEEARAAGESPQQTALNEALRATQAPAAVRIAAQSIAGMRVRIPALGVDASLIELGFADGGQLDIPRDGAVVGWYTISALPGEPGNALLGAHVDWRGSTAVFWRLRDLTAGDMIYIDTPAGELVYRVDSAGMVPNTTPLGEVLGSRSGPQSLTLFTCGGTFDQVEREYDQRFIVRAVSVPASTQALD